MRKINN